MCNDQRDPLEISMLAWGRNQPLAPKESEFRRVDEIPFDHEHKYIVTRHEISGKGEVVDFVSGAPEVILQKSEFRNQGDRKKWEERFRELGISGHRMVAVAMKRIKRPRRR